MYSAIWAYPWDLFDEGIDTVLGRVADAGMNGISVAAAYHNVRALCPHNPKRAVYHGEGGVIYFKPNFAYFTNSLQPVESELIGDDHPPLFDDLCKAAARRNIKVHAWTVLHHNTRLGTANPDCTIVNAFGDRYPFGLCPSNPKVRQYSIGLVRSLAERYPLDVIELESLGYMGIDHSGHHSKSGVQLDETQRWLLSICFCRYCAARMEANGIDVDYARESIEGYLLSGFVDGGNHRDILSCVDMEGIAAARNQAVLTLLEEIASQCDRSQTQICLYVSSNVRATGAPTGVPRDKAAAHCDRFLVQTSEKEPAKIEASLSPVVRSQAGLPVHAGLQAIEPFVQSAEDVAASIQAAVNAGAEGLQFYHYGLMRLQNLDWISAGLESVRV